MRKYFGTDGIRGKFGSKFINEAFAYDVGRAIGQSLMEGSNSPRIAVIGRDTRPSGDILLQACGSGMAQSGVQIINCGILPSPALAFGVLYHKADFGVMITASHNSYDENGIKCFSSNATKLSPHQESKIEELIDITSNSLASNTPSPLPCSCHIDQYCENLSSFFKPGFLKGLSIALDLANGSSISTTPRLLKHFGAKLITSHCGSGKINDNCGSENLESLQDLVVKEGADLGIAHDGDGDRVRFIDRSGKVVNGDQILGLIALHAHRSKVLKSSTFVATVHSNSGLFKSLETEGINFKTSDVGDRNVYLEMQKFSSNYGGESSGHIICSDYLPTGDGLYAALSVLRVVQENRKPIRQLANEIILWPSKSASFEVSEQVPLSEIPGLSNALDEQNQLMASTGRVLLRYSGTEPKIRLLVEGESNDLVESVFEIFRNIIQKAL